MRATLLDRDAGKALRSRSVVIPLHVAPGSPVGTRQPVAFGAPLPHGALVRVGARGAMVSPDGATTDVQLAPLSAWPDGSVRWVQVDAVLPAGESTECDGGWRLVIEEEEVNNKQGGNDMEGGQSPKERGTVPFLSGDSEELGQFPPVGHSPRRDFGAVVRALTAPGRWQLCDRRGRIRRPALAPPCVVERGPVRTTLAQRGEVLGVRGVELAVRWSVYPAASLVRCDATLRNTRPARHRGGLWDLGDPGSALIEDFSFVLELPGERGSTDAALRVAPESAWQVAHRDAKVYQDSSGGEAWRSPVHVNGRGEVRCRMRGYEAKTDGVAQFGLRAEPQASVWWNEGAALTVAIPEFWQNFPQALEASPQRLRIGLFPGEFADLHELQGGEQKTHTFWIQLSDALAPADDLAWAFSPAVVAPTAAWCAQAQALPSLVVGTIETEDVRGRSPDWARGTVPISTADSREWGQSPIGRGGLSPERSRGTVPFSTADCGRLGQSPSAPQTPQKGDSPRGDGEGGQSPFLPRTPENGDSPLGCFETILSEALDGPRSLFAHRERVDEYGWRHWGEIYADHEQAYYHGPQPLISHYNNQFDMVLGFLQQYLRTRDRRWFALGDALARHVIDIDVYHTDRDRSAYSGGLFWFTDHYLTAHTSTHRSYSRRNRPADGRDYGGGPGAEHNFTSGLTLYHFLTGSPAARETVLTLAGWVMRMEDGARTIFGIVDDGPTGLATAGKAGPGRGGANSINALLDAWLLTLEPRYLEFAEDLIRRCVHPEDDVEALDLLEVEKHWSYTMFLTSLAKYLQCKEEADQLDAAYAYARRSLLRYARWMVEHERPYFDQAEAMEFPTEAWAAQELRKANVFRRAARYADGEVRGRLLAKGDEFGNRAWQDLMRFPETRMCARALALVMTEGLEDCASRGAELAPAPPCAHDGPFPPKAPFAPQRARVRRQLANPRTAAVAMVRALNPARWGRWRRRRMERVGVGPQCDSARLGG